jgi:hypothetical protein
MKSGIIPLYSGAGFDASYEYYDFLGRPVRNIKRMINLQAQEAFYTFELYLREKKTWVKLSGPEMPEVVGGTQSLDEHPSGQLVDAINNPAPMGRDASSITPEMVKQLIEDMRKDEIPDIDIREMVLREYPEVAAQVLGES